MKMRKSDINIAVAVFMPVPEFQLLINAVCAYYNDTQKQMTKRSRTREHARRKGILFFLLKTECQLSSKEIAEMCETSRQNVDQAVDKTDAESRIYLQSTCDVKNIRLIFANLRKEQAEWLKQQDSRKSNTKR